MRVHIAIPERNKDMSLLPLHKMKENLDVQIFCSYFDIKMAMNVSRTATVCTGFTSIMHINLYCTYIT